MYLNLMFLDQFLFELSCKNPHTRKDTHADSDATIINNCIKETSSKKFYENNGRKITADMNCESSNLINCISCNGCNSKYIGQPGDTVRSR